MDVLKTYSRKDLMQMAIAEHLRCLEFPRVGAVAAKEGRILATGFRGEIPKKHAERIALEKIAPEQRCGSTLYTTLEPCIDLHDGQRVESCSDLIIASGVREVVIGVLDPNGTIYSQGYRKLLENNVNVSFFPPVMRAVVEAETFEYGDVHKVFGSGRRRTPVVHSGIDITVQFSETDSRTIFFSWKTLQPNHGIVDLSSANGAVRVASGARTFADITDPGVFRFPSHYARMTRGSIAVVWPIGSTFCVIVKLEEIFQSDILFTWEVRNTR